MLRIYFFIIIFSFFAPSFVFSASTISCQEEIGQILHRKIKEGEEFVNNYLADMLALRDRKDLLASKLIYLNSLLGHKELLNWESTSIFYQRNVERVLTSLILDDDIENKFEISLSLLVNLAPSIKPEIVSRITDVWIYQWIKDGGVVSASLKNFENLTLLGRETFLKELNKRATDFENDLIIISSLKRVLLEIALTLEQDLGEQESADLEYLREFVGFWDLCHVFSFAITKLNPEIKLSEDFINESRIFFTHQMTIAHTINTTPVLKNFIFTTNGGGDPFLAPQAFAEGIVPLLPSMERNFFIKYDK